MKPIKVQEGDSGEERKAKIKATVMKLFSQLKVGCKKDLCFNVYCKKNPLGKLIKVTGVQPRTSSQVTKRGSMRPLRSVRQPVTPSL